MLKSVQKSGKDVKRAAKHTGAQTEEEGLKDWGDRRTTRKEERDQKNIQDVLLKPSWGGTTVQAGFEFD